MPGPMTRAAPPILTPFQSLMREWSQLAPYNFLHALRLPAPLDMDVLRAAVATAMHELEIPATAVRIEQSPTDLYTHIDTELQRPFSVEDAPFRFFVLDSSDGHHWLGAVIDHWVADDFSCRRLLQHIYSSCYGRTDQVLDSRLAWAQIRENSTPDWKSWLSFLKRSLELRRAYRVPVHDPLDFNLQTFTAAFPDGALQSSQRIAKQHGVTLHDLFLAATAQAFGAASIADQDTKRDAVAIPSAMDLRRFQSDTNRSGFGLVIGQYFVSQPRPHEVPLVELAKRIALQTRRMKAAPEDLFRPALFLWRLCRSRSAKATLFGRGAPFVAGLSNVNLTGTWIEQCQIPEYRRMGPTGPIVPMVLMITTLHGRIFVDVTFRTTAFTRVEAEALIRNTIDRLSNVRP
jgi:hypothetical protein